MNDECGAPITLSHAFAARGSRQSMRSHGLLPSAFSADVEPAKRCVSALGFALLCRARCVAGLVPQRRILLLPTSAGHLGARLAMSSLHSARVRCGYLAGG